ncbi:hypothetical protein QJS04_geneDACA000314 [Acorus gramineus]|uniref:DNL-type domain-containing protein n=1 Tax=Acorus gramineus TaxID=55184 RepID=A0AAV9AUD5_ACOGR|nr:hypothetical protein QJS04_geneDACA000314 [Acorus gramineus]
MAARLLQRRFSSLISPNGPRIPAFKVDAELSWAIKDIIGGRGMRTDANPVSVVNEDSEDLENRSENSEPASNMSRMSRLFGNNAKVKYDDSNLRSSTRHDFVMIFTCKVCETRSMKTACRESYDKGVVVARCDGCNNLHLIADRLGWFGEPGSVEEFLAARGEDVKKGSLETLNLTMEDLAGTKFS